nr:hypothetical protein [Tanacetum cinerariifolium]
MIAPAVIIDRQLPFEYTITSRSTDVVVMAHPIQNINHSAFRSMFEREKLFRNNFNDWFRQLKLALRVEKKMYVIEQPLPAVPAADSVENVLAEWNAIYDAYNETIGELHAILIEYEKGLPKKAKTPQVMMIKGGKTQKTNKKSLKAKGKGKANGKGSDKQEHPAKDDTCHHCKDVGHWKMNCHVYLAELLKKKKQVGSANSSGFREARKLKQGSLYLYVGNGVRAQVEAIESFDLVLPNGLMICLDNCHYTPSITRGVVQFTVCNGIYEIDMHDLVPNDNSIYNNSTKRAKHNLDSTYLWHCYLAHINMCPRQGASYFITFTDDYSRYGYVYLFKRKHEVFETFNVFKNEVENQLGKTIKALRSNRGGKYISQEFKDYLKACGIVQQLTTPYTPQHNCVSEKRNHILLDMVWRCEELVKRDTPDKLQQRSVKCIFIGYPKETMGYYFYCPPENKIVVARYAEFFEKNLITQKVKGFEPPQEEVIPIRSYKAAMLDSESNKWIDAMNSEIQSMIDNMVWVLVDLPPNCKTIGSKWIFKKKTDMDETFSPVADIRAIRIPISIAAYYDYEIWKMDVKTAFLNGYLDEDIYMAQPEGFVDPNHPRKVCTLQRSIYGLKQVSRSWNKRFDEEIKKFGFAQNLNEPCVYQKASGSNVTFLILYVDEIIIMGNHIPSLQSVKDYHGKCFAMKDLGEAAFILGIKIYRDRSKRLIGLDQNAYMDKILKRYKMDNSKRSHITMQERLDLNKTQGASTPKNVKRMQKVPYASAVGSIMYAVRCTRPDVAFAQNITSRFQQNPGELHWTAVKNILKYLRNTKDMFLVYGGNPEAEL